MSRHRTGNGDLFAICVIFITITALIGLIWHYCTAVHR